MATLLNGPSLPSTTTRRRFLGLAAAIAAGTGFRLDRIALEADAQEFTGRYFAETGHNLQQPFLERWEMAGGRDVLGAPISEERFEESVGVVQSFETVTLVYDPGLDSPWDMQGTLLSKEYIESIAPPNARERVSECAVDAVFCQYFADTGHTLSGRFVSFWSVSGDLPILGKPLSEPFQDAETRLTLQVFEKAVLEDRGSAGVRIRSTALDLAEANGLLQTAPFLPAPPTAGVTKLVAAEDGLRLRAGAGLNTDVIVTLADNAEFISDRSATGDWIPGYADGFSGWVSAEFLTVPPPLAKIDASQWNQSIWQGAALSETNVRSAPDTGAGIVEVLALGEQIEVSDWVVGEEVFPGADQWAKLGEGRFAYSRNVGRTAPVLPPTLPADAPSEGRWIDVQLTQQLLTAYEGRDPARVMVTTTGMAGWETPTGLFYISVRVPNETMTSGAIGAEHFYKLEDVLFTQYFTDEGHAIHFAWWRTPETIGRPGSHGCLNLLLDDSRYLWDWADVGVPILIRS